MLMTVVGYEHTPMSIAGVGHTGMVVQISKTIKAGS